MMVAMMIDVLSNEFIFYLSSSLSKSHAAKKAKKRSKNSLQTVAIDFLGL